MAESPIDIDKLGLDELKALLVQALTRISALEKQNQQLRDEVARLKGLKGIQISDFIPSRSRRQGVRF